MNSISNLRNSSNFGTILISNIKNYIDFNWGHLGVIWDHFGVNWEPFQTILESFRIILESFETIWESFVTIWESFGQFGSPLRIIWDILGVI